jgi:cyclopropane-fatty-acyl-phospholipid synthase
MLLDVAGATQRFAAAASPRRWMPGETPGALHPYLARQRAGAGMRIAVIGTGIAGNAAAWSLSKHFLYLFCVNDDLIQQMLGDRPLMRFVLIVRHWFNRNTKRQARRNIYAHYDIGNVLFGVARSPHDLFLGVV